MDNERLDICEGCDNDPGRTMAWYQHGTNYEICQYCRRGVRLTEAKHKRETGGLAIELAPVEQEAAE